MTNGTISSIQIGARKSWSKTLYLTLDIDWAHDDILADKIDLVEQYGVPATCFVIHDTTLLSRLRGNSDCSSLLNLFARRGLNYNDISLISMSSGNKLKSWHIGSSVMQASYCQAEYR